MNVGGRNITLNSKRFPKSTNGTNLSASHLEDRQPNEDINKRWQRAPPVVLSTTKRGAPWRGYGGASRGWRGSGRGRGRGGGPGGQPGHSTPSVNGLEPGGRAKAHFPSGRPNHSDRGISLHKPDPDILSRPSTSRFTSNHLSHPIGSSKTGNVSLSTSTSGTGTSALLSSSSQTPRGTSSAKSHQQDSDGRSIGMQNHGDTSTSTRSKQQQSSLSTSVCGTEINHSNASGHKLNFLPERGAHLKPRKRRRLTRDDGKEAADDRPAPHHRDETPGHSVDDKPLPSIVSTLPDVKASVAPPSTPITSHEAAPDVPIKHEQDDLQATEYIPAPKRSGSLWYHPLPLACRKGQPKFVIERRRWFRRESEILTKKGLAVGRCLFRNDGMSIDWTSPVLVWPDTLLPVDQVTEQSGSRPPSTSSTKTSSATHSTSTAQPPTELTPSLAVTTDTKQPGKRGTESLGSHDQIMRSSEIIDLTFDDDDEPGPSRLWNQRASSSKKEKRSSRKRSSSRIEIHDLSPSPQPLPSVSYSPVQSAMDTQGQRPSSRSQAKAPMRNPSPLLPSPSTRQSSYAPKRISSEVIVVEDDDEEDNDSTSVVEVVNGKAKAKGDVKTKDSVASNLTQMAINHISSPQPLAEVATAKKKAKGDVKTKDGVASNPTQTTKPHHIPSPQPSVSNQRNVNRFRTTLLSPSLYPANLPAFDHRPSTPADNAPLRPPSHPSVPSPSDLSNVLHSASNIPTSKPTLDQLENETLIPPMAFLSPAVGTDNEGMDEEDGYSNNEQVDELEDDSGLEVEHPVPPQGINLTSFLLENTNARSDGGSDGSAGRGAAAKQSRKDCQDRSHISLASGGTGMSDFTADADAAEVEEIIMYVESDEEGIDTRMNLDNDARAVVGDEVDCADGEAEQVNMTATRIKEHEDERVRMQGLALQFLKQYVQSFDHDRSALKEAYAKEAIFSCTIVQPSSLGSDASASLHEFCPTSPSSSLSSVFPPQVIGPVKIIEYLHSLNPAYKFFPRNSNADLDYDLLYLGDNNDGGGGLLLGVHGRVVKPHPEVQGRDSRVAFDWSIILRPVVCVEGTSEGELLSWPLKAVSHQMIVRGAENLWRPTDVFSWMG